MVTVNTGHIITMVVLPGLDLLLRLLDILHAFIIGNQYIWIFFRCGYWGRNRINDVVEAMNIMLKLRNGVLVLLNLTPVLRLPLTEAILQPPSRTIVLVLTSSLASTRQ